MVVIEGEEDCNTPADHARAWLDRIPAKRKAFIVIARAGHQAILTNNAEFTQVLKAELVHVGPLTTSNRDRLEEKHRRDDPRSQGCALDSSREIPLSDRSQGPLRAASRSL